MNKILLVDVDPATLNTFTQLMQPHSDEVEVMTAGDVREVPNIVKGSKISMVVIDLKMPDNDDLQFLTYMNRDYPEIPVIIITAFGTAEIERRIKSLPSCRYHEKPVDLNKLAEKMIEELGVGVGGQIHGIGLSSFLQMSEMEKTTCRLKISSEDGLGYLYLHKGDLINAETALITGEEAAYEIISWENSTIEIEKSGHKKKREIKMPLMNILMEGLRIKDEKEAAKKEKEGEVGEGKKMPARKKATKKKAVKPKDAPPSADSQTARPATAKSSKGQAPEQPRKKNMLVPILLGLLLVLVLAGGGVLIWSKIIQPKLVKDAYNKVLVAVGEKSSLEEKESLLQEYADIHPESPYALEAKQKIKELFVLIQERDYENAVNQVANLPVDKDFKKKSEAVYKDYLDRFPEGIRAGEIQEKIKEIPKLVDEHDYKMLQQIDPYEYEKRITAYQAYLSDHKNGKYRKEVEKRIADISETYYQYVKKEISICDRDQDWGRCIQLCDKYLLSYKRSKKRKEIKSLRDRMHTSVVMGELDKKVTGKKGDYAAIRNIYQDYLKKHPKTAAKKSIQKKLARVNRKIKEKQDWEAIVKHTKNKKIDLFVRIADLQKYVDSKPEARYRKGAAVLKKRLDKEKLEYQRMKQLAAEQKRMERERIAMEKKERARLQKEKLKISGVLSKSTGRFVVNSDGTVVDQKTGLMWYILDSHIEIQECLDYDGAREYVENLEVGGYKDWQLPSANDLMVVMNSRSSFPNSGAKWYWTSEMFWKGFYEFAYTVVNRGGNTWTKGEAELLQCGAVRAVRR